MGGFYVINDFLFDLDDPGDAGGDASDGSSGSWGYSGGDGTDLDAAHADAYATAGGASGGGSPSAADSMSRAIFSLGSNQDGELVGWLTFKADASSVNSVTTSSVGVFRMPTESGAWGSDLDVIKDGDVIRQVLTTQTLADVSAGSSTNEIVIRYYELSQLLRNGDGSLATPDGCYGLASSTEVPAKEIRISSGDLDPSPDHSQPGVTYKTYIKSNAGGQAHLELIRTNERQAASGASGSVGRVKAGDQTIETTEAISGNDRVVSRRVLALENGVEVEKSETIVTWRKFSWGREEKIEETRTVGETAETTTYEYYEITPPPTQFTPNYARLKWRINPDGSWEKHDYASNGTERIYTPWPGPQTAASPADVDTNISQIGTNCRTLVIGTSLPFSGRHASEQEYLNGTLVKSVTVTESGGVVGLNDEVGNIAVVTKTLAAGMDASSPLTETSSFSGDVTAEGVRTGKLLYHVRPDGTLELYHRDATLPDSDLSYDEQSPDGYLWDTTNLNPEVKVVLPLVDGQPKLVPGKTTRTASYNASLWWDDFSATIEWVWMGEETALEDTGPLGQKMWQSDDVETGWKQVSATAQDTPSDGDGRPKSSTRIVVDHAKEENAGHVETYSATYSYAGLAGQQVRTTATVADDGTTTTETFDEVSGTTTTTQAGYSASLAAVLGAQAQPSITTTMVTGTNAVNGLTTTVRTVSAGTGTEHRTCVSSRSVDALGHEVLAVDEAGRVVTRLFRPANATRGRQEIELYAGAADVDGQRGRVTEYYLDGRIKSITGTRVVAEHYSYSLDTQTGSVMQAEIEEVHYGAPDSPRYKRTARNALGRVLWEKSPNPAAGIGDMVKTTYGYDAAGRLISVARPGMAPQLFEYDALGRQTASGLDLDGSGTLEREGTDPVNQPSDPITETEVAYETDDNGFWEVTTRRTYHTNGSTDALVQRTRRKLNTGIDSITESVSPDGSKITESSVIDRAARRRTVTRKTYRPGDTAATAVTVIQEWANGLLVSQSVPGEAQPLRFRYDALRRPVKTDDPRSATGERSYLGDGRVAWEKDADGVQTTYTYYSWGLSSTGMLYSTFRLGKGAVFSYNLRGQLWRQSGAAYPVEYGYDPDYGEMTSMTTKYLSGQAAATTTWTYQPATGLLSGKQMGGKSVTYTYDQAGRTKVRTWARRVPGGGAVPLTTTYDYDSAGRMNTITYSDSTPQVNFKYDRAGRRTEITDASGTRALSYDRVDGGTSSEEFTGGSGLLQGLRVEHSGYEPGTETTAPLDEAVALLRRTGPDATVRLAAARLERNSARGATGKVRTESGSMTATATYDWSTVARGLPGRTSYSGAGLESTRSEWVDESGLARHGVALKHSPAGVDISASVLSGLTHDANYRYQTLRRDGLTWGLRFNNRMELVSQAAEFQTRTQPDEQGVTSSSRNHLWFQAQWGYDDIGNRSSMSEYSELIGAEGINTLWRTDSLNQLVRIERPQQGQIKPLIGTAAGNSEVSAWLSDATGWTSGDLPMRRILRPQDEAGELGFIAGSRAGAAGPLWLDINVLASHKGPNPPAGGTMSRRKGHLYFPPVTETFAYDDDGNQTDDARWHYTWDAENRLTSAETQPAAVVAGVPKQRLRFTYDSQHRRVRKTVENWSADAQQYVVTTDRRFVYDDWNLIAELESEATGPVALKRTYAWGLDLSGTTQGAGGVGGLVSVTEYDSNGTATRMLAPAYDTNGNIMAYADIATGGVTHRFEYDAFGVPLTVSYSDASGEAPPFRFSTKYLDEETGLYYYGFRYYSPELGRWLNRDPIGERGGINLYGMVGNDAVNRWDYLGLAPEFEGDPALVQKAKDLLDKAAKEGNAEVQKKIADMKSDTRSCKIKLDSNRKEIVTGSYDRGTIDMKDIDAFPDQGPATKSSKLTHEVVEQWEKQINGQPYQTAHQEASKQEGNVSGWSRGAQGTPSGTADGGFTVDVKYEHKITKTDASGNSTTTTETKTVNYKVDGAGNLTITTK